MKKVLTILLIIGIILVLSNSRAAKTALQSNDSGDCSYSNYNGSFTFHEVEFKSRDFGMCLRKFQEFKKQNHTDTVLYRLCKSNYLKFWKYNYYLFDEKFRLQYMPWEEINARRGTLINKSTFQDF